MDDYKLTQLTFHWAVRSRAFKDLNDSYCVSSARRALKDNQIQSMRLHGRNKGPRKGYNLTNVTHSERSTKGLLLPTQLMLPLLHHGSMLWMHRKEEQPGQGQLMSLDATPKRGHLRRKGWDGYRYSEAIKGCYTRVQEPGDFGPDEVECKKNFVGKSWRENMAEVRSVAPSAVRICPNAMDARGIWVSSAVDGAKDRVAHEVFTANITKGGAIISSDARAKIKPRTAKKWQGAQIQAEQKGRALPGVVLKEKYLHPNAKDRKITKKRKEIVLRFILTCYHGR